MEARIVLGTNFTGLVVEEAEEVNQPGPSWHSWANIPILLVTWLVNIGAVVVIHKKETNGINLMIQCDCVVNVLCMIDMAFMQTKWFQLDSKMLCLVKYFCTYTMVSWNRLVPVCIVVFRYMMVCHAVFCLNHGGEKKIWKFLRNGVIILSLISGAMVFVDGGENTYSVRVEKSRVTITKFRHASYTYVSLNHKC